METYAIIDEATNICVNTIIWDGRSKYMPPDGCFIALSNGGEIGWVWDGEKLVNPETEA